MRQIEQILHDHDRIGAVLAPPVMGATAFVIAQYLNVSYAEVALAAIIPATLYYIGLFMQVDAYAARHGLKVALEPIPKTGFPDLAETDRIARACGESNCGLLFDPTHWSRAGSTLADIEALEPGRIIGFQLCDIRRRARSIRSRATPT